MHPESILNTFCVDSLADSGWILDLHILDDSGWTLGGIWDLNVLCCFIFSLVLHVLGGFCVGSGSRMCGFATVLPGSKCAGWIQGGL